MVNSQDKPFDETQDRHGRYCSCRLWHGEPALGANKRCIRFAPNASIAVTGDPREIALG
ncbi:MAG: hypothetical protein WDM70_11135 [Nitrosomonadales bacterium]